MFWELLLSSSVLYLTQMISLGETYDRHTNIQLFNLLGIQRQRLFSHHSALCSPGERLRWLGHNDRLLEDPGECWSQTIRFLNHRPDEKRSYAKGANTRKQYSPDQIAIFY